MTYTRKASGRFSVTSWSEEAFADIDGEGTTAGGTYYPKRGLSHARVGYTYTGALRGTSVLSYLIAYRPGGAPVFAFEHFTGAVDGHEGSCVLQHVGGQDAGSVRGHVEVVSGMGTGELANLRGEAELRIAGHSDDG